MSVVENNNKIIIKDELLFYWHESGLDKYISLDENSHDYNQNCNYAVNPDNEISFNPVLADLVRIHRLVRLRRVTTVLEFGIGYSTLVIAHALMCNDKEYRKDLNKIGVRRNNLFEVHTVDTSRKWVKKFNDNIPKDLSSYIHTNVSNCRASLCNDRIVGLYDNIPNISPDFIYIDGPHSFDVLGEVNGISFQHLDRTIISADIIRMEALLLPGVLVLIDGRTNNARFLKNNLNRNFLYLEDIENDVSYFELKENPLGIYNKRQIDFCLGGDWVKKKDLFLSK